MMGGGGEGDDGAQKGRRAEEGWSCPHCLAAGHIEGEAGRDAHKNVLMNGCKSEPEQPACIAKGAQCH